MLNILFPDYINYIYFLYILYIIASIISLVYILNSFTYYTIYTSIVLYYKLIILFVYIPNFMKKFRDEIHRNWEIKCKFTYF